MEEESRPVCSFLTSSLTLPFTTGAQSPCDLALKSEEKRTPAGCSALQSSDHSSNALEQRGKSLDLGKLSGQTASRALS